MKIALLTIVFTLFSLSIAHVIPVGTQLSPAPVAIRGETSEIAPISAQEEVEARDSCGSSPYQQPCNAGNKIGSGKVIMGALGVMVAGLLLRTFVRHDEWWNDTMKSVGLGQMTGRALWSRNEC
ncbi:uncharacterized protein LY89DRAFT_732563 [Mollisia scopiformis]|uniref:Uncharacterized protein n=1 Tax=Mollisia scopiformis TaxID=149040 RepID=A0A194XDM3_MOLSC|nr:uncharacterized protein LY89DRAFT_732563 [Mollisia scopiformis]KUJ17852.1 hypothetical protein LY89DRAFT_732563 [Mollisia scopiformis]